MHLRWDGRVLHVSLLVIKEVFLLLCGLTKWLILHHGLVVFTVLLSKLLRNIVVVRNVLDLVLEVDVFASAALLHGICLHVGRSRDHAILVPSLPRLGRTLSHIRV